MYIGTMGFLNFFSRFNAHMFKSRNPRIQSPPYVALNRFCHYGSNLGFVSSDQKFPQSSVAIFWDLDNKHPKSVSPYDAAVKLKKAASSFGAVRYMVAYANRHAFSFVPPQIRDQRKDRKALNKLENNGVIKPAQPYLCRVCGRKFYTNDKLVNHFKQLHEREQMKRLNQIESARGNMRVKLVAKFSMKMDKYKRSVNDVLIPKVGYGLADELKRAGFWVKQVSDKPQAADDALRSNIVDMMDKRRMDCLVLVSDDSDFVDVLNEAKARCLKTVVVGDVSNGALKRASDASFSWKEILLGKAMKQAVTVVGKWKDLDILKRLEWQYDPETEETERSLDDDNCEEMKNDGAWWELDVDH